LREKCGFELKQAADPAPNICEFELDDEAGFLSLLNPVLRQGANYVP